MKKKIILMLISFLFTNCTVTHLAAENTKENHIVLLEQRSLNYPDKHNIPFAGISDLAYNPTTKRLYMIGDRGYLYRFEIEFDQSINTLNYLEAFPLKNRDDKIVVVDSEGLDFNDKNELIISFERKAQISKMTTQGKVYLNYNIPKKFQNKRNYKNGNSMFEGITHHPKYGILVAAEYPINHQKNTNQTIYGLDGKEWHFQAESYPNSAITALEVMDDDNLLVLERAYNGLSNPFYITLKKVYLNRCDKKRQCPSEVLITFDSSEGWGFNNYEGLTKVGKNRYLMVSDNNYHPLLSTTLTYFEVKP